VTYDRKDTATLLTQAAKGHADLVALSERNLIESNQFDPGRLRDYLRHGVGRRIGILRECQARIFELFSPARRYPLPRDTVTQVQIYLHAFVVNVAGILDNWAWTFVLRHQLHDLIEDPLQVGLFRRQVLAVLPDPLREYLQTEHITNWHREYLKDYRDALAHRIPLYVPPVELTKEQQVEWETLEVTRADCIAKRDWERLEEMSAQQERVGTPSFVFLHEFSPDGQTKMVAIHPQLNGDAALVVEFGNLYYDHWMELGNGPAEGS
jgi:hypothetical protein